MKGLRVAISTLGCKVNQFESAALENAFVAAGCTLAAAGSPADIHVINTCAVTARAGQQSRQLIRRIVQRSPAARILVTGCYAQAEAETVRRIDARILLVGNAHKEELVQLALIADRQKPAHRHSPMAAAKSIFNLPVRHCSGRSRALLRIQDGCNNHCSYCIVPHTRGRSRSLPRERVFAQAALFAENGYRELVVTGINTGSYGLDLAEGYDLTRLLAALCARFPTLRFRLSSIEPTEIDEAFLDLAAGTANLMPHFHIPLQSGDDRILARMRRRYSASDFAAVLTRLHKRVPQAAIGCDVLAAFPGETDAEAANTRALLAGLPVSYLHVFPYSKRPGTPAAAMEDQVAAAVRTARVQLLHQLDQRLRQRFYHDNLGRSFRVLVERRLRQRAELLQGFSENYIPISFAGPAALLRRVVNVRLEEPPATQPCGRLLPDDGGLEEAGGTGYSGKRIL